MTTSLRFHILSCFSIPGGLSTVYGLTLAAQGASRYSVAALLTRPPRKTCSLRFRIEFALRLYHSNRAVAREYQKNIKAFAKISDNRVKFVAFSIRSCYNSFRTWGYSSVGRALASHVRGQGFDSPYLHQRFELRLKAIQRTGSSAQMPLPFSLARTLPRSPLRSDNGHRNRDGSLCSPIPSSHCSSLRLPLSPPRQQNGT